MRRRPAPQDPVPSPLRTFDPGDWPGPDVHSCYLLWRAARWKWAETHVWPEGPLERIRQERAVRP